MRIERLAIAGFRNYEREELRPEAGITVLSGANAQGKTNIIEAIYLCCVGRSHRTKKDAELVRWGSDTARVSVRVGRLDGPHDVSIRISPLEKKKKEIKVNLSPLPRMGELMGHVNAVLFSPEDLRLVKDGPEGRRRFLDMEISQLYPAYFYALQRYIRALNQRNGLLRQIALQKNKTLVSTLDSWDALLADAGAQILARRLRYLAILEEKAREIHLALSGGQEGFSLRYTGQARGAEELLCLLRKTREEDMRRMSTGVGPHRDDFKILLNGRDARSFASQGQQRTIALSLKLAEIEVIRGEIGEYPVLLLDDVMSELDVDRRKMLLTKIGGIQTLITCTHINDLGGAKYDAAYVVREGTLHGLSGLRRGD